MHAEPITFGLKLCSWYQEMRRNRERLVRARVSIAVGKISGAVGTYAHLDPAIEIEVCRKLGLAADPISTQVVQRYRHADYLLALAQLATSLEKFALEIRHLQRTEVGEVEEPSPPAEGLLGDAAQKNDHLREICGLAPDARRAPRRSRTRLARYTSRTRRSSGSPPRRLILMTIC
jgi:adenylosuccinate lyase